MGAPFDPITGVFKNPDLCSIKLTILSVRVLGTNQDSVKYKVRRECCGTVASMTHRTIAKKLRNRTERCRSCATKETAKIAQADDAPGKTSEQEEQAERRRDEAARRKLREREKRESAPPPPMWPVPPSTRGRTQ